MKAKPEVLIAMHMDNEEVLANLTVCINFENPEQVTTLIPMRTWNSLCEKWTTRQADQHRTQFPGVLRTGR